MSDRIQWDDLWKEPESTPTASPPGNVIELPRSDEGSTLYGRRALESECGKVANAAEGTRNDALNRAAYRMARLVATGHLNASSARAALDQAGRACGLPQTEIDLVLRDDATSALNQGQAAPRQPKPLPEIPTPTVLTSPEAYSFWDERETLSHVYMFARARCVAPWAVLGAALARVVAATGPNIVIPPVVGSHASLNLFVGLVGRSGSGKGAAESVAREAFDVGRIETRNTGSGEGAVHAYMKRTREGIEQHNTSVLFSIPEIDTLGAVGARQGATLMPLLRSAWSGEQLGFQYADPMKNLLVPAHQYRMCIVAGIQPGRAGTLLDDSDGGTPQRFLWLPAIDPEAPDVLPDAPDPRKWSQPLPDRMFTNPNGFTPVTVCDEATRVIKENRVKAVRGEGDALDGHALLTRLKTAVALALLEQRLEVTEADWRLSGVIADVSAATRGAIVDHIKAKAAESNRGRALAEADRAITVEQVREEKALTRVRAAVVKQLAVHGEQGRSALRKRLASRDRVLIDEAIEALLDDGRIESVDVERNPDGSGGDGAHLRLVKQ